MKFPLTKLYDFNICKPTVEVEGVEGELQWDECDLEGLPPYRIEVGYTSVGKPPKGQWDNLPEKFTATDGKEYLIEDIIVLS